jgi:hypothetical protein
MGPMLTPAEVDYVLEIARRVSPVGASA